MKYCLEAATTSVNRDFSSEVFKMAFDNCSETVVSHLSRFERTHQLQDTVITSVGKPTWPLYYHQQVLESPAGEEVRKRGSEEARKQSKQASKQTSE